MGKKLDRSTVGAVVSLLFRGRGVRATARELGVSVGVVSKIRSTLNKPLPVNKGGRPKKLGVREENFIVRLIRSGTSTVSSDVKNRLVLDKSAQVSVSTIRRILHRHGYHGRKVWKKPQLSRVNKLARMRYAQSHKDWTIDDWKRVLWSDETKINRVCSDGITWGWSAVGKSRPVRETLKYGGGSIMIWGCFGWNGVGCIVRISGNMNAELYRSIVEEEVVESMDCFDMDLDSSIFMQDNDPKHKSKMVMEFIKQQKYELMNWPSQSPDLNPIENLWKTLKSRLGMYEVLPSSMYELWERVKKEWLTISVDDCRALISSMPRRIQAVLHAKGKQTKY